MENEGSTQDEYQRHAEDVWKPMPFSVFDAGALEGDPNDINLMPSEYDLGKLSKPLESFETSLRLPDLENFAFGDFQELEIPPSDSTITHSEIEKDGIGLPNDSDLDFWSTKEILEPLGNQSIILTWEGFHHPGRPPAEASPRDVSDSGPEIFDALLHELFVKDESKRSVAGQVVVADVFLRCMTELGLGRSSVLFPCDESSATFTEGIEGGHMSGYSGTAAHSVIEEHISMGNAILKLRKFCHETLQSSDFSPELVALASSTNSIMEAVESHITASAPAAQTLTQLQGIFRLPFNLIRLVSGLIDVATGIESSQSLQEFVYQKLRSLEEAQDTLAPILRDMFGRVAEPFLDSLAECVGFRPSHKPLPQNQENNDTKDAGCLWSSSLVSSKESKVIFETATSLSFLLQNAPDELVSRPHVVLDEVPRFSWAFTVEEADGVVKRAQEYEASIKEALKQLTPSNVNDAGAKRYEKVQDTMPLKTWELSGEDVIEGSLRDLGALPNLSNVTHNDSLASKAHDYLENLSPSTTLAQVPIESLIPLSLGPLLRVQHSLLSVAALRTLLHAHSLQTHLKVHRAFHLHGSGAFTSRLARVLFSPDLVPAERVKGVVRTGQGMGLRLGSGTRRDWPPASSEVQLALAGVLNDSWRDMTSTYNRPRSSQGRILPLSTTATSNDNKDLPGGLSFAIRTLTEPEIERVLQADSIYALDFLRLSHTAPPALQLIFPEDLREKYDRVFKLLLRLQRVKYVLDLLFRTTIANTLQSKNTINDNDLQTTHLFISQARHFTTTLLSHFELWGIARHWRSFQIQIDALEKALSPDSSTDLSSSNISRMAITSLSALTFAHTATLNQVTSSLFQRKRHAHVSELLDVVMGDVLLFAKVVRDGTASGLSIRGVFQEFRVHVAEFVGACTELSYKTSTKKGREGEGEEQDAGPESAGGLVALLDWR